MISISNLFGSGRENISIAGCIILDKTLGLVWIQNRQIHGYTFEQGHFSLKDILPSFVDLDEDSIIIPLPYEHRPSNDFAVMHHSTLVEIVQVFVINETLTAKSFSLLDARSPSLFALRSAHEDVEFLARVFYMKELNFVVVDLIDLIDQMIIERHFLEPMFTEELATVYLHTWSLEDDLFDWMLIGLDKSGSFIGHVANHDPQEANVVDDIDLWTQDDPLKQDSSHQMSGDLVVDDTHLESHSRDLMVNGNNRKDSANHADKTQDTLDATQTTHSDMTTEPAIQPVRVNKKNDIQIPIEHQEL